MRFLCLAYGAEDDWGALTAEEQAVLLAHDEALRQRGDLVAAVEPAVTTVRAWDGKPSVTTGAAARSDLPLAGFYVVEAGCVEEAVRLVADTPCARAHGAIEIWPITTLRVGPR